VFEERLEGNDGNDAADGWGKRTPGRAAQCTRVRGVSEDREVWRKRGILEGYWLLIPWEMGSLGEFRVRWAYSDLWSTWQ
jgi:hypothetical protein